MFLTSLIIYNLLIVCLSDNVQSLQTESIINGQITTTDDYPYHVFVRIAERICNGAIISERHVVTAAHCLTHGNGKIIRHRVVIVAGVNNFDEKSKLRFVTKASKVYVPESFHPVHNLSGQDIAIIKLENVIPTDNPRIKKVELPDPYFDDNLDLYADRKAIITGFGCNEITIASSANRLYVRNAGTSRDLRFSKTRILSSDECLAMYPGKNIASKVLCARMEQRLGFFKGACMGDSGGPLVVQEMGVNVLIGVLSYGNKFCNERVQPSVYTRVTFHRNFIKNAMAENFDSTITCHSYARGFCSVQ